MIAIHEAFKRGDLEGLKSLLGNPSEFPNYDELQWIGHVLEYAIFHSPLPFIRQLLELGANPNYEHRAGFPSLIAALSTDRSDKAEIVELLLSHGANIQQVGHNGYTPLHWAAADDEPGMVELLLKRGADPKAKTTVDDCTTPLEEAENFGREKAAAAIRKFLAP